MAFLEQAIGEKLDSLLSEADRLPCDTISIACESRVSIEGISGFLCDILTRSLLARGKSVSVRGSATPGPLAEKRCIWRFVFEQWSFSVRRADRSTKNGDFEQIFAASLRYQFLDRNLSITAADKLQIHKVRYLQNKEEVAAVGQGQAAFAIATGEQQPAKKGVLGTLLITAATAATVILFYQFRSR